jgi:hypothetical protein
MTFMPWISEKARRKKNECFHHEEMIMEEIDIFNLIKYYIVRS